MKQIKEIYSCDNCQKEFGKRKHLSINFGNHSGWVGEQNDGALKRWGRTSQVYGIKHFCNGTCMGKYFDDDKKLSV